MTLGIMQPYLFPYIGYWQLINAVDTFVIYDDVNYIKQGYINRNSILSNGRSQQITLELIGASSNKFINEIKVGNNSRKIIKSLKQNYIKAPYFKEVSELLENILLKEEKNLAKFIGFSIEEIATYLNIKTQFIYSSNIKKDNELKAQDKVIDICKQLKATNYINAIGGQDLYSKDDFNRENIQLNFLDTELIEYKQLKNDFIPYLSIIDILMFNSENEIKEMLNNYKLV